MNKLLILTLVILGTSLSSQAQSTFSFQDLQKWWGGKATTLVTSPVVTPTINPTKAPANFSDNIGATLSFYATNAKNHGIAVKADNIAYIVEGQADQFIIRAALNGNTNAVSFESAAKPGHFLRHSGFVVRLNPKENSPIYLADASFKPIKALNGNASAVSFQSENFPDRILRHSNTMMWIGQDKNESYNNDCSWIFKIIKPAR
jgi:hypothetical protein